MKTDQRSKSSKLCLSSEIIVLLAFFVLHRSARSEQINLFGGTVKTIAELEAKNLADLQTSADNLAISQPAAQTTALSEGFPGSFTYGDAFTEPSEFLQLMRLEGDHPLYYTTFNAVTADTISTDEVYSGGSAGLDLNGATQTVGIWDGSGIRVTHQELAGRVTQQDGAGVTGWHATAVCGTMGATGVVAAARGSAFQAAINAYDWNSDLAEVSAEAVGGLLTSNHSYGFTCGWSYSGSDWYWYGDTSVSETEDYKFGYYLAESRQIDNIIYLNPYYLSAWAAGNDRNTIGPNPPGGSHFYFDPVSGAPVASTTARDSDGGATGYDTLHPHACAKNNIKYGSVADIVGGWTQVSDVNLSSFSSVGPTDDGRVGIDVVANGADVTTTHPSADNTYTTPVSGTSFATPSGTGSAALLREHHQHLNPTYSPRLASTIKALIIHGADEAATTGPDYLTGWGLMNTQNSARIITDEAAALHSATHIIEILLLDGENIEFSITSDSSPLKGTLCWSDAPGTVDATRTVDPTTSRLVNDLDLRLIAPDATENFPYVLDRNNPANAATTGDNSIDNIEQIHVDSPQSGTWTVRITHKGTLADGYQRLSLILTGNVSQEAEPFKITDCAFDGTNHSVTFNSTPGITYRMEYSTDLVVWTEEPGDIPATKESTIFTTAKAYQPRGFWRVKELSL